MKIIKTEESIIRFLTWLRHNGYLKLKETHYTNHVYSVHLLLESQGIKFLASGIYAHGENINLWYVFDFQNLEPSQGHKLVQDFFINLLNSNQFLINHMHQNSIWHYQVQCPLEEFKNSMPIGEPSNSDIPRDKSQEFLERVIQQSEDNGTLEDWSKSIQEDLDFLHNNLLAMKSFSITANATRYSFSFTSPKNCFWQNQENLLEEFTNRFSDGDAVITLLETVPDINNNTIHLSFKIG